MISLRLIFRADSEQRQIYLISGIAACDLQIAAPPGGDLKIPISRSEDRRLKSSRSFLRLKKSGYRDQSKQMILYIYSSNYSPNENDKVYRAFRKPSGKTGHGV